MLEGIPGYYSSANGDSQIKMTQTIYDKRTGEEYFTNAAKGADGDDGKHFWNLAIRTDPGVNHEDLGQRGTLEMNDRELAETMCAAMNAQGVPATLGEGKDGEPATYTISYTWE